MINEIKKNASDRMQKSISSLEQGFMKIRTGRAHPSLLEHIKVEYYGQEVPINQVANINAEDASTLSVNVWERDMITIVEKAVINSDLGLNPATAGSVIRIPMPPLTEERRTELVRVVKQEAENAKIAIRNIRRDANHNLDSLLKDKKISEDENHDAKYEIQNITDKNIKSIDVLNDKKQKELMQV
jgi:ribosome recycling factor